MITLSPSIRRDVTDKLSTTIVVLPTFLQCAHFRRWRFLNAARCCYSGWGYRCKTQDCTINLLEVNEFSPVLWSIWNSTEDLTSSSYKRRIARRSSHTLDENLGTHDADAAPSASICMQRQSHLWSKTIVPNCWIQKWWNKGWLGSPRTDIAS